jgi:5-methyltetrahydrofolate--homocysteine methyltransferase
MSFEALRPRLKSGRPLVLDADTCASFRARGVVLDTPGAVGRLLREQPANVVDHYRAEVQSRVTVLTALTADSTPRALSEAGMEHRSALLTGLAVELAFDVASGNDKPVAVAGVLGSDMVAPMDAGRWREEVNEHARRIATAGVELMIARGQGSRVGLMSAVVAGASTELPTWAVVECGESGVPRASGGLSPLLEALEQAGASAVLFEVLSVDDGLRILKQAASLGSTLVPGILLQSSPESVRGFPDNASNPKRWAARALELDSNGGARIIGGGAGTTEAHTACLAAELGALHPSLPAAKN